MPWVYLNLRTRCDQQITRLNVFLYTWGVWLLFYAVPAKTVLLDSAQSSSVTVIGSLVLECWKCRLQFGDGNDHVIRFLSLNTNLSFGKRENWRCTRNRDDNHTVCAETWIWERCHGGQSVASVQLLKILFCCTSSCRSSWTSKCWVTLNVVYSGMWHCAVCFIVPAILLLRWRHYIPIALRYLLQSYMVPYGQKA